MTDPITDERLREIATSDPSANAIFALMYDPSWADVCAIAAELLTARADLRKTIKLIGDAWACQESDDWRNEAWELIEKHREMP